ncbi:MAG: ABC transporter permease [Lachnospiraceae bacterium]|nr:ABC transporter permease [Lachnospiraceae bacterium]
MKGARRIIKKELARVFKDKKLIFTMFIMPAILMFAIYGLIGKLIASANNDIIEHKSAVTIVNAPEDFKQVIEATGYRLMADVSYSDEAGYESRKTDIENEVINGQTDLLVCFDKNFEADYKAYEKRGDKIPGINIFYNSTENYSQQAYNVFNRSVITPYRETLQQARLGDLEKLEVFGISEQLLEKESKKDTQFLSMMLPYLLVIMLFSSAMGITVDAIAGEKERGTLSSMLLAPISRSEIVVGKLVSLSISSTLSAFVYCVSMIFAMPMMMQGMGGEVNFSFISVSSALMLLAIILLMNLLFVSLISLLSIVAKDSKTASTLVSPVYIVVVMAGVMTMFSSGAEVATWKYAIPVYGNALVIQQICSGEVVMSGFLASIAGLVVMIAVIIGLTTKAFNSEKIMFNA